MGTSWLGRQFGSVHQLAAPPGQGRTGREGGEGSMIRGIGRARGGAETER